MLTESNPKLLQRRLDDAERKIRVLEDMIENSSRELYIANQDLKHKNKDLEQIIYIVSHDLQEPLTTLYAFLGRLAEKHHQELSSQGQEYLDYANISAERMKALIKGLLDHSRIGAKR
ncbi:MAG: histidine kinase dimerization/phospho-acceptor domain-containing protein, partial [Bacteroidota bacterium]|nr:histidine kinase dimerization/phospho-acceptor domain-containing protein [Bacteroidota bacterium]